MREHNEIAKEFIQAIKTISEKQANLDNFESYLSHHFNTWIEKFANTPDKITAELKAFANMDI